MFQTEHGVLQGSSEAPLLFLVYINGLAEDIKAAGLGIELSTPAGVDVGKGPFQVNTQLSLLMYADDLIYFTDCPLKMQELIYITEVWCKNNRIEVNLGKSKIMHVRPKTGQDSHQSMFCFLFNNNPVAYVDSYKYLGVTVNHTMSLNKSLDILAEVAGRSLSTILSKLRKIGQFPEKVYSNLVEACCFSVLDYSTEAWPPQSNDGAHRLLNKAIRNFLVIPQSSPLAAGLTEMGWLSNENRRKVKLLSYFSRISAYGANRLVYQVSCWDKHLCDTKQVSGWHTGIKQAFLDLGHPEMYTNICSYDHSVLVANVKEAARRLQYAQNRHNCLQKPSLHMYNLITNFEEKPSHLKLNLKPEHRGSLMKAKMNILDYTNECRGRWPGRNQLPRELRLCRYCGLDEIDSVSHLLLSCNFHSASRGQFFRRLDSKGLQTSFYRLAVAGKLSTLFNELGSIRVLSVYLGRLRYEREQCVCVGDGVRLFGHKRECWTRY